MNPLRRLVLWSSRNAWLSQTLPRYRFVQRAVRRFMPGEELEAALAESRRLADSGASTVLTLLGENTATAEEARAVVDEYLRILEEAEARALDAQISIKPTQLGLELSESTAYEHADRLARRAEETENFLWIDMEGSAYTDVTLDLFRRLRDRHQNVGVCLQAYLYRTREDLDRLLPLDPAIRLVKGAYAEPPAIAFPKKRDVDASYLELARRLLDHRRERGAGFAAFGTHDPTMTRRVRAEATERGLDSAGYELEMLFGIGRAKQRRLLAEGARLRVLISYGEAWFPWYMRRLAERPANLWFVLRSVVPR